MSYTTKQKISQFNLEDIVVYNGVITKLGVIYELIDFNDVNVDIRLAKKAEKERYYNRPEK